MCTSTRSCVRDWTQVTTQRVPQSVRGLQSGVLCLDHGGAGDGDEIVAQLRLRDAAL
jgi:hypothetical protein